MKTRKAKHSVPYHTGYLPIRHNHNLYFEEHGHREGRPVVWLHGGPGGGMSRAFTRFFDLRKWRVILYDQRGCGKSTPFGVESLAHNTTWDLVQDIEDLRQHLAIEKWMVIGGSWGTTLALAYAETHPNHVSAMLLRGVCLMEPYEYRWLYENTGSANVFPEKWTGFVEPLPLKVRDKGYSTIMKTYRKLLTSKNTKTRRNAAKHWWDWESAVSFLEPRPDRTTPQQAESLGIIENHYFTHNAWLKPHQLLKNAHRLKHIPMTIIHGRYDLVVPVRSAWALHNALPHSKLQIVAKSGHGSGEKSTSQMIKRVINSYIS